MAKYDERRVVPGSAPIHIHNAVPVGRAPEEERFDVTVRVRRRAPLNLTALASRVLTREEYEAQHGAAPEDMEKVADFARHFGLVVTAMESGRRSVFLSGTVAQFEKAFGTLIEHVEHEAGVTRQRQGELTVPEEIADLVEGVFGIQDTPIARPHFQIYRVGAAEVLQPSQQVSNTSFTPVELARLYNFPQDVDGSGQCIAIIELGGGYRTRDLVAYFKRLNLPSPKVTTVRVDGGKNQPGTPDGADGEVMLDIEVAAAVAPRASIVVYFAPNTDKGFLDAVTAALHDKTNRPSVISISWGGPEKNWTGQAMASFDEAFQAGAALGVTICCASGDAGSGDENPDNAQPDGLEHVDFPSSSPHVLACGGTRLVASGGGIASETVWNDDPRSSAGGGGVSDVFDVPDYQRSANIPPSANPGGRRGRGVPDVAGNADPQTGYQVRVDGEDMVIGGTSAVAPLWAGLIALFNQKLGRPVGFLQPVLYSGNMSGGLRDVTSGNNGAYRAGPGWDCCTGWGSPDGLALLASLAKG
ncbi:protease pro-enzyme activation domain-containing protein [Massilia sp. 9096]|uniref:S53 family peptidase n=1 Tax=Massilia sp. 9096 TaxID=1500894 RepID=UPI00055A1006|nr:S53 family peptidase [Massilia sp. 9096]